MDGSVIIIGSGLGGLECGYILAKHGMKVTVLEQSEFRADGPSVGTDGSGLLR